MARFGHDRTATVGVTDVSITGRGVGGHVNDGVVGAARGVERTRHQLDAALEELERDAGDRFARRARFTVDIDHVERGSRGGGAVDHPAVRFRLESHPGEQRIAFVDVDGFQYLVRPDEDGEFEVPVTDADAAARGMTQVVGRFVVRVVAVFAGEAVATGAEHAIRNLEERFRPYRVRSFQPGEHLQREAEPVAPERFGQGPSLVLVHGCNSAAHHAFRFDRDVVRELHRRYGGRVAAFDHPSLCHSPRENAIWLAEHLEHAGIEQMDVLAHSRGGIVARELLDVLGASGAIRSIVFVATPNNGTPLADADHLGDFVTMAANLTTLVPDNPVTDTIGIGLEAIRSWVLGTAYETFSGIACASPGSDVLTRLATADRGDTVFRAVASQFEPRRGSGPLRHAADVVMDAAFRGAHNDLLVPTRSAYDQRDRFHVAPDDRLVLDGSFGVTHTTFWSERAVLRQLTEWLDPAVDVHDARPVDPELTDPGADFERATRTGDGDALRRACEESRPEVVRLAGESVGRTLGRASSRHRAAGAPRPPRGTVIVVPGMFGSRLRVAENEGSGDLIWPNSWALARGGFARLEHGVEQERGRRVFVDGVMPPYAPLLARLVEAWQVRPFAYDWRLGIDELADQLADFVEQLDVELASGPVHFIGHAMGGLIARAFIGKHAPDWAQGTGRLVQLGTPNWGSLAMVAAALGDDVLVRAMAVADRTADERDIRRTLRSFPSLYQLFPSPYGPHGEQARRLYDDSSWLDERVDPGTPDGGRADVDRLLADAATFHEHLRDAPIGEVVGEDRVVFVAGDGQDTPAGIRLDPSGGVSFSTTTRGDGRVSHELALADLGIPEDRTFFVDARHGDLPGHEGFLDSIDELLATGTTDRLRTRSAAVGRGRSSEGWVRSGELERSLGLPVPSGQRGLGVDPATASGSLDLATRIYVGGGEAVAAASPLRVGVVHCSMEQAKYAVAAGRYKGIPMEGAISFLNHRLDGALSRLQEFDLFPEDAGTARYVPPSDDLTFPRGAIVVGLGEFGQLSSTQLTRSIERGAIEYAVARQSGASTQRAIGISSVLIGTPGRYGLSVQSSIYATVQGIARAAARLKELGIIIDELEFIELYEGKAEEAAMSIAQLSEANRFSGMEVPIAASSRIDVRPGGRPGSGGYEESGAPWLRLQLCLDDPTEHDPSEPPGGSSDDDTGERVRSRSQKLTWVALGRSSQAERLEVHVPTAEIRRHVRSAVHDPVASGDTNLTLFEMLFPHDAKLELDERDNLQLLVDQSTAWIPWELVTGRDTDGKLLQPLARRAGVLRQLIPDRAERPRRTFRPVGRRALVVGDPPGDPRYWPRLPGARDEARIVTRILRAAGFEVTSLIYDGDREASADIASEIRNAFFAEHYRVIHIAGHGTLDQRSDDPFANGVVIGPDEILSAGHFEDRLVTPDLVFLNCCHLGRIDTSERQVAARRGSYAELAASTSLQLMRIGVRAVVAAGWAVDDGAASTFAESFYSRMIGGTVFGESVRVAREDAFDDRHNTWGAYQCYGDPDFQFFRTSARSRDERWTVLSSAHLVKILRALEQKAGDADTGEYADRVAGQLRELEEQQIAQFETPAVWEAFARAYGEAGAFDDAVYCFRKAVDAERADAAIGSLEKLANLESRLAAMVNRRPDVARSARITDTPAELCEHAERLLDQLMSIHETSERWILKGSLYKRWASIEADRRDEFVRKSRDAYQQAARRSRDTATRRLDAYHGCLALQLAYLAGRESFDAESAATRWQECEEYRHQLGRQLDELDPNPIEGDYFERTQWIDIRSTLLIFDGELADPDRVDEIVDGYQRAFRVRSSAKHRRGVIDHFLELSELLEDEAQRGAAEEIARRLEDG